MVVRSDDDRTIAIIDDNIRNVDLLSDYLQIGGYQTVAFTDPVAALRQVLWIPPRAIIVDLHMPVMDGLEFITRIAEELGEEAPPCIILSADDSEENMLKCFEAGANDYLRKPYSRGELLAKLKRVLGLAPPRQILPSPDYQPQNFGEYRVISELGRGGMGVVYRVRRDGDAEDRALKAMWSRRDDVNALLRFRRELDALSNLDHAGLVRYFGAGRSNSVYYYVMQYIDGESLELVRDTRSPLSSPEIATLTLRLGEALGYLHENGLLHRDVKPANIIIDSEGAPHLVDFGLAKCSSDAQITRQSELVGTPHFMSPEAIRGLDIDGRSDLFSLGMVALELLLGGMAIDTTNPYTALEAVTSGRFPKASSIPGVDPGLGQLVDKMLELDPELRHLSATELCHDLQDYLSAEIADREGAADLCS